MVYYGETVWFEATFKDEDGELYDPDSHSIKVYDPDDGQYGDEMTDPTKKSLGVFRQKWTAPNDGPEGIWRYVWIANKGGDVKPETLHLLVEPT